MTENEILIKWKQGLSKELLAKIVLNDSLNLFYIHTNLKEQIILLHCRSPPINTIF